MVGILAVQGAFAEHQDCIRKLGGACRLIRQKADLQGIDRLILVGGESTVQRKLIRELDLFETLNAYISEGMPTLGTCAGLILLAQEIENESDPCFRALPVKVKRNAYGRQLGSFSTAGTIGNLQNFPMRFIRAPYISEILDENTEILNVTDGNITAVKYKNRIGLAFHPELTDDLRIHKAFLEMR